MKNVKKSEINKKNDEKTFHKGNYNISKDDYQNNVKERWQSIERGILGVEHLGVR